MLSYEASATSLSLVQLIASKGFRVEAIPGTPLAELITASGELVSVTELNSGSLQATVDLANAVFPGTDIVKHDAVMDQIVAVASKTITQQLAFARTVVAPIIADIVQKTEKSLNDRRTGRAVLSEYRVDIYNYPDLLFNQSFIDLVDEFSTGDMGRVVKCDLRLPAQTFEEVKAFLLTGSKLIDTKIEEWIAARGEAFLLDTWNTFFSKEKPQGVAGTELKEYLNQFSLNPLGYTASDRGIAILLLADHLFDSPIEGTEMNLSDMNSLLAAYRETAATFLHNDLDNIDKQAKHGILIRSSGDKTVVVNGHVYADWLKIEGNSVEILLGTLLKLPTKYFTIAALEAEKLDLVKAWAEYVTMAKTSAVLNEVDIIRSCLTSFFIDYMVSKFIEDPDNPITAQRPILVKKFEQEISQATPDELRAMWLPVTKGVCRVLFPASRAEEILIGMDTVSKSNPDIDPRQAATFVVIELVSKWVASQIKVCK
jgi:hypothetical protein